MKLFKRKEKVSIEEMQKSMKQYSKNQLTKELICLSQKYNYNQCGVPAEFKKEIKKHSKKQLIKAIILIKVTNHRKIKRALKKAV